MSVNYIMDLILFFCLILTTRETIYAHAFSKIKKKSNIYRNSHLLRTILNFFFCENKLNKNFYEHSRICFFYQTHIKLFN